MTSFTRSTLHLPCPALAHRSIPSASARNGSAPYHTSLDFVGSIGDRVAIGVTPRSRRSVVVHAAATFAKKNAAKKELEPIDVGKTVLLQGVQ